MMGLLDFAQSASNAAASNVSGPVDLITWLLQKAGIPIKEPIGGSAWMERQGLTRPVQQSAASLAGETAGLLSPVAAAAKAPQIAKGLLQMGENAAARPMLNPQTGAIVWHASPHKFDKFDSSKINTGEGAQSYGPGLYFAESPKVSGPGGEYFKQFADHPGAKLSGGPHAYKVDLPDEQIARMLDWDKPLNQQSTYVLEKLKAAKLPTPASHQEIGKAINEAKKRGVLHPNPKDIERIISEQRLLFPETSVEEFLGLLAPMPKLNILKSNKLYQNPSRVEAAEGLQKAGIPGIRYLDGDSRGAGTGTSNYVVFPGEEGLLKILERNGVTLGGP